MTRNHMDNIAFLLSPIRKVRFKDIIIWSDRKSHKHQLKKGLQCCTHSSHTESITFETRMSSMLKL